MNHNAMININGSILPLSYVESTEGHCGIDIGKIH
jgi:hypothetical protein